MQRETAYCALHEFMATIFERDHGAPGATFSTHCGTQLPISYSQLRTARFVWPQSASAARYPFVLTQGVRGYAGPGRMLSDQCSRLRFRPSDIRLLSPDLLIMTSLASISGAGECLGVPPFVRALNGTLIRVAACGAGEIILFGVTQGNAAVSLAQV